MFKVLWAEELLRYTATYSFSQNLGSFNSKVHMDPCRMQTN